MKVELQYLDEDSKDILRLLSITEELGISIRDIAAGLFLEEEMVASTLRLFEDYGVSVRDGLVYLPEERSEEISRAVWEGDAGRRTDAFFPTEEEALRTPRDLFESKVMYDAVVEYLRTSLRLEGEELDRFLQTKLEEKQREYREDRSDFLETFGNESRGEFKSRVFGNLCGAHTLSELRDMEELMGYFVNDLRDDTGIAYLLLCQNARAEAAGRICEYTRKRYFERRKEEEPIAMINRVIACSFDDVPPKDFDPDVLPESVLIKAEYENGGVIYALHELRKSEYDCAYHNLSVPQTAIGHDYLCGTQNTNIAQMRHENAKKITYICFLLKNDETQPDDTVLTDVVDFNGERSFDDLPERQIPKRYMLWFPESLLGCGLCTIEKDFMWDLFDRINGITFPMGLTEIGEGAFEYCDKIGDHLAFPMMLSRIKENAFRGCRLRSVLFLDPETEIAEGNFHKSTEICAFKASSPYYYAMERGMRFTDIEEFA